jgi:ubiquitin carboxyl-terminal hydrolase 4/11
MFDLGYFTGSKELVPSGWNIVDDDKTYPTLSSRNPQLQQSHDDESGNDYDMTDGRAGSESSNDGDNYSSNHFSDNTRMTEEETSDEDELVSNPQPPRVSQLIFPSLGILASLLEFYCLPCWLHDHDGISF